MHYAVVNVNTFENVVYFDIGGGPDVKAFLATSGVLGCSR